MRYRRPGYISIFQFILSIDLDHLLIQEKKLKGQEVVLLKDQKFKEHMLRFVCYIKAAFPD
jgi:hypothetical protein